jgi:hypothetical protein
MGNEFQFSSVPFIAAYIECAFFTNQPDGNDFVRAEHLIDKLNNGEGDDIGFYKVTVKRNFSPERLAPTTLAAIVIECQTFREIAGHHKGEAWMSHEAEGMGRDFWYTREGHGVGFWDGDWDGEFSESAHNPGVCMANILDDLATSYGKADWYVGDDGLIYQSGAETWEQVADIAAQCNKRIATICYLVGGCQ